MSLQYSPINNPFAILNLSGDSIGSKINTRVQRVLIECKLKGDSASFNLPLFQRAAECLNDPVERFRYGFFWLTLTDDEESSFNTHGVLTNIGIDWCNTAELEYDSIASAPNLTLRNHNKAILQLGTALSSGDESFCDQEDLWLSAFRSWVLVLDSSTFWDAMYERAKVIDDPRLNSSELSKWRASTAPRLLEYIRAKATSSLKDHDDRMALHWVDIIRKSPFPDIAIDTALSTIYEPFTKSIELKLDNLEGQISGKASNVQLKSSFSEFKSEVLPAIKQLLKLGDLPGLAEEHARDRSARFLRSLSIRLHNKSLSELSYEANQIAKNVVDSKTLSEQLDTDEQSLSETKLLGKSLSLIEKGRYTEAVDHIANKIINCTDPSERRELEQAKKEVSRICATNLFNEGMQLLNNAIKPNSFGLLAQPSKPSKETLVKVLSLFDQANSFENSPEDMRLIRKAINDVKQIKSNLYGSSCFVATATFGSPDNLTVINLRSYRDLVLEEYALGRTFILTYWLVGPTLASVVRFTPISRFILKPLLKSIAGYLINTKEYQKRRL